MIAQFGGAQAELRDAAVHDGGGRGDIAVGARQLGQLPQQPAIGRQPQRELLHEGNRLRRQTFALYLGKMAWLELPTGADILDAEKIVEVLCVARLAARSRTSFKCSSSALRSLSGARRTACSRQTAAWPRSPCICQAVPRLAARWKCLG